MNLLVILNDAPYGSERTYNGLRLATWSARQPGVALKLFLIGDASACARKDQKVPIGYYNVETMLTSIVRHGAAVGVCGTCMDARGMNDSDLVPGTHRGSMDELTAWTLEAEKVIGF